MNILVIASGDYFSNYGGGQIYVKNLVEGLEKKHFVNVISLKITNNSENNEIIKTIQSENCIVYQFNMDKNKLDKKSSLEMQPYLIDKITEFMKDLHIDIIHANGWKYLFAQISEKLNLPYVLTAHHGGIICPNGMMMDSEEKICNRKVNFDDCSNCSLSFVPAGKIFKPIIKALNKNFVFKISDFLKTKKNIPFVSPSFLTFSGVTQKIECVNLLKKFNCKIITPSNAVYETLIKNDFLSKNLKLIHHGVKISPSPKEKKVSNNKIKLGYVGRINHIKGLHVLIDALKKIDKEKYELHIYGSASTKDEKKYLLSLQNMINDENIIFERKVPFSKINDIYNNFDLLIVPSILLEIFGLIVLESMTNRTPVIASKCGGPEDLINDGVDGYLVKVNDVNSLFEKINYCIENPEKIEQLSKNIKEVNSLENHILEIEEYYKKIIG